jgi:hypothetical protein
MAWTETYHCDVCSKSKGEESGDWWLAWMDAMQVVPDQPSQPMLKMAGWHLLLAHTPGVMHLCGARCAQTLMDRWMTKTTGAESNLV